ncbi:hypothetical protein IAD21_05077 [Abditibacteriota bacterium]|nr:hypothetical protein IAD21_05077 [Abditibacteriota bacterium]
MKYEFAILPWEHPGAEFDPTPHAQASLEIAGKKRIFLLKMRDGIIYFKDPKRVPTFAILQQFDNSIRGDELICAWRDEMERENFGRCYTRPLYDTDIIAIIRADFSGWISNASHLNWHEIPKKRNGKTINIWKTGVGDATWRAINRVGEGHLMSNSPSPDSPDKGDKQQALPL